ncbi:hypothetical protein DAPK24_003040 [Pichia kluyveri]|uniref:Uncharacterized protein n=1 Tax=Pichia kluyveri TaxID=36015 RepID=A0AAV5QZ92_PICKL|nr:hypothetical protein DAPK24_003040 [Pichia kluyveri]
MSEFIHFISLVANKEGKHIPDKSEIISKADNPSKIVNNSNGTLRKSCDDKSVIDKAPLTTVDTRDGINVILVQCDRSYMIGHILTPIFHYLKMWKHDI